MSKIHFNIILPFIPVEVRCPVLQYVTLEFFPVFVPLPPQIHVIGSPLVGCPFLLIEYIHSYPPYLDAVDTIRIVGMPNAV